MFSKEEKRIILIVVKVALLELELKIILIVAIASTNHSKFALDLNGFVWNWGENESEHNLMKPFKMEGLQNIVSIYCGANHCVFIDKHGVAWGYGYNGHGRLKKTNKTKTFPPFPMNIKEKVISAACGYEHTLILLSNGEVAVLGNNRNGQLGNGLTKKSTIEYLSDIVDIAVGEEHSLVLRKDGIMFGFGSNAHGQIGHGLENRNEKEDYYYYPYPNKITNLKNIESIACGRIHSIAKTKDNRYFSWGCNFDGRLGYQSEEKTIKVPREIIFE